MNNEKMIPQTSIIPIMHCFDNNYVIPAAVAFYSLLDYADKNYYYKLYVLHSDITQENQQKLKETISCFQNAEIVFVEMNNQFEAEFAALKVKGHFSKEVIYKLITPSLFKDYDKLMIADVDVVYLSDVVPIWNSYFEDEKTYLAGNLCPCKKGSWIDDYYNDCYKEEFSNEEISILKHGIGGGFLISNLKKMREDNIESKCVNYLKNNAFRLRQLEQDVINLVCYPNIKYLPCNTLVPNYLYDLYNNEKEYVHEAVYSISELEYLLNNPVQLHFAGGDYKPWKTPVTKKSRYWYLYLCKTPFFYEHMKNLESLYEQKIKKEIFAMISFKRKLFKITKCFLRKTHLLPVARIIYSRFR